MSNLAEQMNEGSIAVDMDVVESNPYTMYVASATGSFDHNTARVLSGELFGNVDKATHTATFGTTNTDYYEDNQSYDLNATGKYTLLGRQHDLVIGANYSRMYNYGTSYYGTDNLFNFQTIDIWNYSYAKPSWSGLPEHTSKGAVVQRQYGIYGNTRFHLTGALTAEQVVILVKHHRLPVLIKDPGCPA